MTLMAHAAEDLPSGREFAQSRFAGGAHLMACVRCLHAAVDLCGTALYHALDLQALPATRLSNKQTYPHKVLVEMRARALFPDIVARLDRLCTLDDFIYVKDISNASKHRTLICTPYTVSLRFDGSPSPHGFRIEAFNFEERRHQAIDADKVAGEMQVRIVGALIDTMNALNKELLITASAGA